MATKILLAHGHTIVRHGLRTLIDGYPNMRVVADAADGDMAVRLAFERRPHVAVLDAGLPGLGAVEATRQIRRQAPQVKVLVLSTTPNGRAAAEYLQAGALGFVSTECASEELIRALQTVLADQTYLSVKIADMLVDDYIRQPAPEPGNGMHDLTPRQQEILHLVADGHSTKQIALSLNISPKTVDSHRKDLMERLNLDSVAKLTKFALRTGLTTLDA